MKTSYLVANQMVVISLGKIYQPPFPKWYNPDATEQCMALKRKVQSLIEAGWMTFLEDQPNIKTNPLANHGRGAVNVV